VARDNLLICNERHVVWFHVMEHLIYQPFKRTFHSEIRDAAKFPLEVQDWSLKDSEYGICAPAYPRMRWLSHPHEDSSYLNSVEPVPLPMNIVFLDRYGPDWDVESILKSEDLRCAYTLLRDLEDSEVILQITAYVQSWLYFGLLEVRNVPVNYAVRFSGPVTALTARRVRHGVGPVILPCGLGKPSINSR
jgi:hypothetical protein